jgi:hypothetical protein
MKTLIQEVISKEVIEDIVECGICKSSYWMIPCFTDGTQSIGICEDCQKIRTIIREMVR